MSVTVASIITTIQYDLLEDSGLSLGLVTTQEALDYLGIVLMDFLRRTAIIRRPYTQQISTGVSTYTVPDQAVEVFSAFVDAQILARTEVFAPANPYWPTATASTVATVLAWHQDQMKNSVIEILPPPNFTGTAVSGSGFDVFVPGSRDLTIIASVIANSETWVYGATLDTIPDSFTPYLIYGVLEKIFGMNGEAKDEQRALYCRARYEEGIALAKSIVSATSAEPEQ